MTNILCFSFKKQQQCCTSSMILWYHSFYWQEDQKLPLKWLSCIVKFSNATVIMGAIFDHDFEFGVKKSCFWFNFDTIIYDHPINLQIYRTVIVICKIPIQIIHTYKLWQPYWRPYWIFCVRKGFKWVDIDTIVLGDPRNIQIGTIILSLIQYKSNYKQYYVLTVILAAILDFSKCSMMQFLHYSDLESMGFKDSKSISNNCVDSIFCFFSFSLDWENYTPNKNWTFLWTI